MQTSKTFDLARIASKPCIRDIDGKQEVMVLDSKNTLHLLSPEGQCSIEYGRAGIRHEDFFDTKIMPYNPPSITTGEETIFGLDDGRIFNIDRYGRTIWQYSTEGPLTTPIRHNGHVFIGTRKGVLALKEGRQQWLRETGQVLSLTLMELNNKMVLVAGGEDNNAYCMDLGGGLCWSYKTKGMIVADPEKYKNVLKIGSFDGYSYTLSGKGELIEKRYLGSIISQSVAGKSLITSTLNQTFVNERPLPYHSMAKPEISGDSLIFKGPWSLQIASINAPERKYKKYLLDHNPLFTPKILKGKYESFIVTAEEKRINLIGIKSTR
ncbi:MAG: PQQ-binding-like beta-propeller repeat protein [Candidatus Woesearchaeota archaeon]